MMDQWKKDDTFVECEHSGEILIFPTPCVIVVFLNNVPTMTALFNYLDLPCPCK
jgi:hypothetical protein